MRISNLFKGALLASFTVAVAASAVAAPRTMPTLMPAKSETVVSPSGWAKVRDGKIVGQVHPIAANQNGNTRNVPAMVTAYDSYQLTPGVYPVPTGSTNTYGTQQGSFAYPATYQVYNYIEDMKFVAGTEGRTARWFMTGYRSDLARTLALIITPEWFQDRSGFGPAFGFSGDGVALIYGTVGTPLAAGFYRLSADLTIGGLADVQVSIPASSVDANANGINETAHGFSVTMAAFDGTNLNTITSGGGSPAYRHNLSATDPVITGTGTWSSDRLDWEDQIDDTYTGVGTFTNKSDYFFDDATSTAGLGANAYAEFFDNTFGPSVPASILDGSVLNPAFAIMVDNNARVIKGTVNFSDLTPGDGDEPIVVFAQVNVGTDERIIPVVNGNFEILDTNQAGAGGVRTLSFKVDHWLRENVTVDTTAGSVTGVVVDLNDNGDANFDNSVDLLDYFDLSDAYNKNIDDSADWFDVPVPANPVGPGNLAPFMNDKNRDDSVDLLDYFILSDNYNEAGADPLP
jgi:hypothetical protein